MEPVSIIEATMKCVKMGLINNIFDVIRENQEDGYKIPRKDTTLVSRCFQYFYIYSRIS